MEQLTANLRAGLRDSAQRFGLADFWRWWVGELRALVPRGLRNALRRRQLQPVLVFRPEAAVLLEPRAHEGGVAYAEVARIPARGEATEITQAARAAVEAIARTGRRAPSGAPGVVIALERGQALRKRLTYPAPVEGNLAQVLAYDLDRHTPFKAEDLYYDAAVVGRDATRNEIRVELVAALRSLVDQLRRQVAGWGAEVVAVVPDVPTGERAATRLDLLPEAERARPSAWRRLATWVPIVLAVALLAAAIVVPILQKRASAIALLHRTEQAQLQAAAADALRSQLERSVEDYNFVLSRKYAYPSVLQLLDDVTRLLPDDTWLTQFEIKSTGKGKEPHREIMLRGESGNAGRLVSLLEESQLFEQAAPRSPTTKIQPGPGEIFDLGAQLKPAPLPTSIQLANAPPVQSPAPAASSAAAPGSPTAAAGAPPAAKGTAAAGAVPVPAPGATAPGPPRAGASAPAPSGAPAAAASAKGAADAPAAPRMPPAPPPARAPAPAAVAPPLPTVAPESATPRFGPAPPESQ